MKHFLLAMQDSKGVASKKKSLAWLLLIHYGFMSQSYISHIKKLKAKLSNLFQMLAFP